jgi:hypothetical protein
MHLGLTLPSETKRYPHPFTRLSPRGPVQDPSARHRARSDPDSFEPSLTRNASGQLMHLTLSKTSTRAPRGYRLAQGLSMRPHASRRWPRFGRWPRLRVRRSSRQSPHCTELDLRRPCRQLISPTVRPVPPSSQCRFCCRLVKDDGFHDTGRLPPPRSLSRALRAPPGVATRARSLAAVSPSAAVFRGLNASG